MVPSDDDLRRALDAARPTPPPDLADRVLARIAARTAAEVAPVAAVAPVPGARVPGWTWLAVGAAAAAAAALVIAAALPSPARAPTWRSAAGRPYPDGVAIHVPARGLALVGTEAVVDASADAVVRPRGPALALERGQLRARGAVTVSTPFAVVVAPPDADVTVAFTGRPPEPSPEEPPMIPLKPVLYAAIAGTVTVAVIQGTALIRPTGAQATPVTLAAGQSLTFDQGGARPTEAPTVAVVPPPATPERSVPGVAPAVSARIVPGGPPCDDCADTPEAPVAAKVDVEVGGSPTLGPADACVTMVVFTDYECSFCEKALSTLHDLAALYPRDVRIAVKNLPLAFHEHAFGAAEATLAAQAQGKFWEMHDALLANQDALDRRALEAHAERLGLDMDRFRADLDGHRFGVVVKAEALLATKAGVKGVPAFLLNGSIIQGARPLDELKVLVDAELATCRAAAPR